MSADDKADDNCNKWLINLAPAFELHISAQLST